MRGERKKERGEITLFSLSPSEPLVGWFILWGPTMGSLFLSFSIVASLRERLHLFSFMAEHLQHTTSNTTHTDTRPSSCYSLKANMRCQNWQLPKEITSSTSNFNSTMPNCRSGRHPVLPDSARRIPFILRITQLFSLFSIEFDICNEFKVLHCAHCTACVKSFDYLIDYNDTIRICNSIHSFIENFVFFFFFFSFAIVTGQGIAS